jgi:putative tricarboxylic transport membrane protein
MVRGERDQRGPAIRHSLFAIRPLRIRSPKDFWAGLIFIAIGGGFVLLAQQYRLGDLHRMGPAMFPTLVGTLLAALGAILALRAFAFDGTPVPRFYARPIGISLLAIVLFGIALQWLGLVAAIAALVLVGAYAARDVRPLENLALAVVMILFSVAVFVWLLGLPLPLWPNS